MVTGGFDYYFEADMAANPPLPASLKMLLGALPRHFGTPMGMRIRDWAKTAGLPLVWASAPFTASTAPPRGTVWPRQRRILDPSTAAVLNLPAAVKAHNANLTMHFDSVWALAAAVRAANPSGWQPNASVVGEWWRTLANGPASALGIEPLYASSCASPQLCIGVIAPLRAADPDRSGGGGGGGGGLRRVLRDSAHARPKDCVCRE